MSPTDDEHHWQAIETYLAGAPAVRAVDAQVEGGGHQGACLWIDLLGNVRCFAKLESAPEDPQPRHEAAAWRVLRLLGWAHLGSPTVYRSLDLGRLGQVRGAVLVWAEDVDEEPPLNAVADLDLFRAAIFDYLIDNSDRQHNWLGVTGLEPQQLLLIDHGHAFRFAGRLLNSTLWGARMGLDVPEVLRPDVEQFRHQVETDELLRSLLEDDQVERLVERAAKVIDGWRIPGSRT